MPHWRRRDVGAYRHATPVQAALLKFRLLVFSAFLGACGGAGSTEPPPACEAAPRPAHCPPLPPPATVTVSGTVHDDFTGEPVAGATITIDGRTATTGPDGRFRLDSVETGGTVAHATATGFDLWSRSVTVQSPSTFVIIDLVRANTRIEAEGALFYLPPATTTIRAVFLNLFNNNSDSRPLLRGELDYYQGNTALPEMAAFRRKMLAFARTYGVALMGAPISWADTVPESYRRLLEALTTASIQSGRTELEHAPLVMHGFGTGGCVAYGITLHHAERVVGFVAEKLGLCLSADSAAARTVPGYLIHGGLGSTPDVLQAITSAYERNRAKGALWALGVAHDEGHSVLRDHDLLFRWLGDALARRLPGTITPGVPVVLRAIEENTGWLGDGSSLAIGPWACYPGDRTAANWLPSERTARDWQRITSRGATTSVIACGS